MVLISMKEEWRCVLLTSGEQCVVTLGTALMQLLSARILDMLSLMVCCFDSYYVVFFQIHRLTVATARTNAYFGAGTGPIYLEDVACSGSETSLLQCSSDPLLSGGCSHSQDAGVECEGNYFNTTIVVSHSDWSAKYNTKALGKAQKVEFI